MNENSAARRERISRRTVLRGAGVAMALPWLESINVWGADLVQYLKEIRSQGGVNVSFTGDAMSIYENRVELDPVVKDPWGLPVAKTFYKHDTWDVEMSKYALRRLEQGGASFPVMGGEARTGIPVRLLVDPAVLREHSPSVDQRA
jgi:hypothetical protein